MFARQMIKNIARNFPHKKAYICGERVATWRDMDERSDRLTGALTALGCKKGDTVSILSLESITVYEHLFACMKLGLIRVGVNTQYAWPEIRHVLVDSSTKILLVDARCKKIVDEHLEDFATLGIVLLGYNGEHQYPYDYETLLAEQSREQVEQMQSRWSALASGDLLMYSYTSGTTGVPKGVMLTQGGIANIIVHCTIGFGFGPDDIWSMPAASAWVVVLMNVYSLSNGMTNVIPDGSFQIASFMDDLQRHRVTTTLMVPTMMQRAMVEQQARPRDLSAMRFFMYGSAPATPKLIRDARALFGVAMIQTYGQTETTGGWLTVLTEADHQLALASEPELLKSIGRVGVHFECSVRDEQGRVLPPNSKGEIWLRGAGVMAGYLNLPEATAEVMRGDWLRTNDIGKMDERGYVYLLDRQKFMIITGAVNVFPSTVEAVLSEHPAVQEVAVTGVPHPEWGEAVFAVVVKRATHASATAAEILQFCDGKLSRPETPKHLIFVNDLMKTVNGKVRKTEIRAWLLASQDKLIPWGVDVE